MGSSWWVGRPAGPHGAVVPARVDLVVHRRRVTQRPGDPVDQRGGVGVAYWSVQLRGWKPPKS
jgi:hypothetical protein